MSQKVYVCPMCDGTKWYDDINFRFMACNESTHIRCPLCEGKGFVMENEKIEQDDVKVKIPLMPFPDDE